jgi:hypothetical protein
VYPSRYWTQLERYLEHVPEERILVVDSDELRLRRTETLTEVFGFLGVDPQYRTIAFERRHDPATTYAGMTGAGRMVLRALDATVGSRADAARRVAPGFAKAGFRRRHRAGRPLPSTPLRGRLEDELRPEVERLRAFTRLPFAGWSL